MLVSEVSTDVNTRAIVGKPTYIHVENNIVHGKETPCRIQKLSLRNTCIYLCKLVNSSTYSKKKYIYTRWPTR